MAKSRQQPRKMLDLDQFESLEDAMTKAEPGTRYRDVAGLLASIPNGDITMLSLFWMSMITRCQGLHSAIAREIRHENAAAVFPLVRAYAEAAVVLIYAIDHPAYVETIAHHPSERPKHVPARKSVQALISYASSQAAGFKDVYAELSEATHFGSTAMWAAIHPGDDRAISWTSYPRWRPNQGEIACAQVLELADVMEELLRKFAVRHLGVTHESAYAD